MNDLSRPADNMAMLNDPMKRWFEAATNCQQKVAEEMGRFVSARMQQNMELWANATKSGNPMSLFEIQVRWMNLAAEEYLAEMHKLASLTSETLQNHLNGPELEKPVAIRSTR